MVPIPEYRALTPDALDALELAVRERRRVALRRRGTEYVVVAVRQKVTMVFQNGALFDSISVGENVAFPLRELETFAVLP